MSTHIEVEHMAVKVGFMEYGGDILALFVKGKDSNMSRTMRDPLGFTYEAWVPEWYEIARGGSWEVMAEVGKRAASCHVGGLVFDRTGKGSCRHDIKASEYVALWEKTLKNPVNENAVQEGEILLLLETAKRQKAG